MATLSIAAAIAACDAIVELVDVSAPGNLIVTTVSGGTGTTLAELPLNNPAFGAGAVDDNPDAIATLDVDPAVTATAGATGTAAGFALRDGADAVVISGSVGLSGASPDIVIDNTSIVSGQTVNLTSLTVTVAEAST